MTMLKTNSFEYKEKFQNHILECINSEDVELKTPVAKLKHLFAEFDRVANHKYNLHKLPNEQERLADYLMGLPFDFEFSNHGIIKLAEELHECKLTEDQKDTILSGYWKHLAFHLLKLRKEYISE